MSTRDNHSDQVVVQALASTDISSDTTTNGTIIDTANYDMGVKFAFAASAYTDGSFAISFEEGDEFDLTDATAVSADQIIGGSKTISAVDAPGVPWAANGVFSNKRYVRAVITSTGVLTGATIIGIAVSAGEYLPVDE